MTKRKYTIKMDVYRLELMFKRENPCKCCPKRKYFMPGSGATILLWKDQGEACRICKAFIDIHSNCYCPCYAIGGPEAIERTYLAIKKHREEVYQKREELL